MLVSCRQPWLKHDNLGRLTSVKGSKDQIGAITLSHDKGLMYFKESNPSVFLQRFNSANHRSYQYCFMDARAGRWLWISRGKSKHLKTKCYRRMLGTTYREPKTNKHIWQQVNVLTERQQFLQSSVKSVFRERPRRTSQSAAMSSPYLPEQIISSPLLKHP